MYLEIVAHCKEALAKVLRACLLEIMYTANAARKRNLRLGVFEAWGFPRKWRERPVLSPRFSVFGRRLAKLTPKPWMARDMQHPCTTSCVRELHPKASLRFGSCCSGIGSSSDLSSTRCPLRSLIVPRSSSLPTNHPRCRAARIPRRPGGVSLRLCKMPSSRANGSAVAAAPRARWEDSACSSWAAEVSGSRTTPCSTVRGTSE